MKKAILLFETALVVLLVAIISVFLVRSCSIFLKSQKKSKNYMQAALLIEKKFFQMQRNRGDNKGIEFYDTEIDGLKKAVLKANGEVIFDVVVFKMDNQ
ncbi:MAG: hypothetical protein GY858_00985 [Candidatus Omnitrophica bacterium]|nr:hypothetical protein [Candidatus Omnitrophota bacterium]